MCDDLLSVRFTTAVTRKWQRGKANSATASIMNIVALTYYAFSNKIGEMFKTFLNIPFRITWFKKE